MAGYRNIMKIPYDRIYWKSSETCMWNLSPFGEVKIFHEKMPTGPAIEILWKFHTFSKFTKFHQTYRIYWNHHLKHACEICKIHQISSNLQLLESSSGEVKIFHEKMPTVAGYRNIMKFMKFSHLFKVHQISSNWQNLLESSSETCMWNLSPLEKLKFFMKNADRAGYRNIMKIPYLFKVHQISSNWQNLLESSSETCMWNLSPFGEVKIFHEKMPTGPAIEILWKFHTFSKFTKFHQTYRIYWNHHLKHACEIWSIRRSWNFSWKNDDSADYRNIMKIHLFKVHQISSNWQNLLSSEIWVHSEKLKFFMKKWRQCWL